MEELYKIEEKGDIPKSEMVLPTVPKVKEKCAYEKRNIKDLPKGRI